MKKLTRKLFISILSMAFAVIAIGTTTFAWITISTTADIEGIEATVETGAGGIELSLDYGTQGTNATWSNIVKVTESNFIDFADTGLSDVTWDGTDFKELVINDNTAAYDTIDGEKPYIEFKVWIRNTNPDGGPVKVTIDNSKVKFDHVATSGSFTSDVTFTDNTAATVDNLFVSNAARMKISTANSGPFYFEKESGAGFDNNYPGNSDSGWAQKYFEAKGISLAGVACPNITYLNASSNDQCVIVASLGEDIVEITVCVWVEGWDSECHANILSQTLKAALGFNAEQLE